MIDLIIKILLILLLVFGLMGCITFRQTTIWEMPTKPNKYPISFVQKDDGLFINKEGSLNLLKNIEENDAYIEKLEVLIKTMKKHYGDK